MLESLLFFFAVGVGCELAKQLIEMVVKDKTTS